MRSSLETLCCTVMGLVGAVVFFIIFLGIIAYSVAEEAYNWINKKVGMVYASM